MNSRSSVWIRLGEWLLHRRWWLVAVGSLGIFAFEFLEYEPILRGVSTSFFFEITFYGIILPVSTGLILTKLAESRAELAWSLYYEGLNHNLSIQLNNAYSYVELAESILQFVKVILPLAGLELYKYEQGLQSYQPILSWSLDNEEIRFDSTPPFEIGNCDFTIDKRRVDLVTLQPCLEIKIKRPPKAISCYCFPFYFSNTLIAVARFQLPSGSIPTPEQTRLIKEVAPEIASAFQRIQLERLTRRIDGDNILAEQQRIARDVHDTLGHSLAYLRLRLDQISMEISQTEVNILKREVENLRDVAQEAYHQMRNILVMLSPDDDGNIEVKLERFATMIEQRVNFELQFNSFGKSHHLPQHVQRNIYYIFQEALANIEKHANAKKVNVELHWNDAYLTVHICDDGVGFDTDFKKNSQFGLSNMQKRAAECNAQLSISSQVNQGTQLILDVPYGG